jgi:pyruvate dehydrogenase E2 component (dihydrolipoamide acetyltransferase)
VAYLLHMPEIAANATGAVLQDWSVAERAGFAAGEALATVETDKAIVEIEAEADGVVLEWLVPAGAQVEVGAPIAVLGDPGEQVDDIDALRAALGVAADRAPSATAGRVFASPLARKLAREAGLSVAELAGSGPGGRIVRRDVEAAVAQRTAAASAGPPAPAPPAPAPPAPTPAAPAPYTEVPHTRTRRVIATRLTESKQTVPHFYLRATIDAGRLLALRAELNDGAEQPVSVTDLVVKAVARAHTLVPELNVTWSEEAVRRYAAVDIGIAVATDRGVLTPVLRGVDTMPVTAVARAAADLAERARAGRSRQEELAGGSVTVTNLGMFGTEEFAAIINPPQAAILAVGAVRDEPVVREGTLCAGKVMRVTLSVDHRPVDGVAAAGWMREFVSLMEKPLRILA